LDPQKFSKQKDESAHGNTTLLKTSSRHTSGYGDPGTEQVESEKRHNEGTKKQSTPARRTPHRGIPEDKKKILKRNHKRKIKEKIKFPQLPLGTFH